MALSLAGADPATGSKLRGKGWTAEVGPSADGTGRTLRVEHVSGSCELVRYDETAKIPQGAPHAGGVPIWHGRSADWIAMVWPHSANAESQMRLLAAASINDGWALSAAMPSSLIAPAATLLVQNGRRRSILTQRNSVVIIDDAGAL